VQPSYAIRVDIPEDGILINFIDKLWSYRARYVQMPPVSHENHMTQAFQYSLFLIKSFEKPFYCATQQASAINDACRFGKIQRVPASI
jgi:hypothetical protein